MLIRRKWEIKKGSPYGLEKYANAPKTPHNTALDNLSG
jgi:hypothetical protein